MEALKIFDIEELLKRQKLLDKKFDEKQTIRKRTASRIMIAYFAELGELTQELKSEWNYWKNSTKKINKQRALEELSDVLHFFLSYLNKKNIMKNANFEQLENNIIRFNYSEETLEQSLLWLFEIATEIIYWYSTEDFFISILNIALKIGSSEREFLKVHHEVWLRNMGERTKEEY